MKKVKLNKADDNLAQPKSWDEFRDTGLLWFINTILNVFGWGIYVGIDDDGNIVEVFPARCKFRGFVPEINDEGYFMVTDYLKNNIDEIHEDFEPVEEDGEE